jgi:hypothetical protein
VVVEVVVVVVVVVVAGTAVVVVVPRVALVVVLRWTTSRGVSLGDVKADPTAVPMVRTINAPGTAQALHRLLDTVHRLRLCNLLQRLSKLASDAAT